MHSFFAISFTGSLGNILNAFFIVRISMLARFKSPSAFSGGNGALALWADVDGGVYKISIKNAIKNIIIAAIIVPNFNIAHANVYTQKLICIPAQNKIAGHVKNGRKKKRRQKNGYTKKYKSQISVINFSIKTQYLVGYNVQHSICHT